jgi:excisionase family DNA binding protein
MNGDSIYTVIKLSPLDLEILVKKTVSEALSRACSTNYQCDPVDSCELLTRKNAAKLLNISLSTLNSHTKSGRIQGHRIGGRVLYRKEELLGAVREIRTFI